MTRTATRRILPVCRLAAPVLLFANQFVAQTPPPSDMVRVMVSMNADGSRTTYQWDAANHKATATTTDGKNVREKIRYVLDDNGRFVTGEVLGPKDKVRFVTRYKYDTAGRVGEESQSTPDGVLQHRIVHSYNTAGKETGYIVYDANGRIEHREGGTR
ncbi:MAG: hypothetical protein ACJ8I9_07435 [Chthoniobacterales bacterium]